MTKLFEEDGLHPSLTGTIKMAATIREAVSPNVSQRRNTQTGTAREFYRKSKQGFKLAQLDDKIPYNGHSVLSKETEQGSLHQQQNMMFNMQQPQTLNLRVPQMPTRGQLCHGWPYPGFFQNQTSVPPPGYIPVPQQIIPCVKGTKFYNKLQFNLSSWLYS